MSGLDFGSMQTAVQTAMSYWLGALSEPVLIIGRDEMARAAADGAIVWDVRPAEEIGRNRGDGLPSGSLTLGDVGWLLADNSGGNLIPAAVIEDTLGRWGIQRGRAVVIYSERHAVDAFVALRALRSIGIGDAQVCLGDAAAVETASSGTWNRRPDGSTAVSRPAANAASADPRRAAKGRLSHSLGQPA
jgi:hypothetical protein